MFVDTRAAPFRLSGRAGSATPSPPACPWPIDGVHAALRTLAPGAAVVVFQPRLVLTPNLLPSIGACVVAVWHVNQLDGFVQPATPLPECKNNLVTTNASEGKRTVRGIPRDSFSLRRRVLESAFASS